MCILRPFHALGAPNAATERGQPFRLAVAFAARPGHRFVLFIIIVFYCFFGGGDRVWGLGMLRAYIGFRDV